MAEWSTPTVTEIPLSDEGKALAAEGWRLLSFDPVSRKEAWMRLDGDEMKVRTVMPVDDLLDENAAMMADSAGTSWGDGKIVSRIPMHIWQRELGEAQAQGDEKYVRKWLNNADHSKFRVRGGKV